MLGLAGNDICRAEKFTVICSHSGIGPREDLEKVSSGIGLVAIPLVPLVKMAKVVVVSLIDMMVDTKLLKFALKSLQVVS